jgi:hypothetical protein
VAVGAGTPRRYFSITREAPTPRTTRTIHRSSSGSHQPVLVSLTCIGCGKQFVTTDNQQRRCTYKCGYDTNAAKKRRHRQKISELEFIGVDGEGIKRPNGDHEYVLLSVGDKSLHRNGETLTYEHIFPFLYNCFRERPDAVYVGFALGYDFTMWFKHLPQNRAAMMLTDKGQAKRKRADGNPIPWGVYVWIGDDEWEFDLHAGKRFRLRPRWPENSPWMFICDAFSFYQSSFLKAIDPSEWPKGQEVCTPEEYETIREGKLARGDAAFDETMIAYNVLENLVMGRMMASLHRGLMHAGIYLQRDQWYGPGQAAGKWLDKISAPTAKQIQESVPPEVRDAARRSYFGGWFEIFAHGIIPGKSYEYDIHSAYPYIISQLPCLLHGEWLQTDISDSPYGLVYGTVEGSDDRCGGALHRNLLGRVFRPQTSRGWFWRFELEAAIAAGTVDRYSVEQRLTYLPCDCSPPLSEIAALYADRLSIGKKTPEGRGFRLIMNSTYGKTAQSVGTPKYANPVYASLITAKCRTMILEAIASHPHGTHDLLMVATDGVYFRTPHPTIGVTKDTLGTWDATTHDNLTLFLPGMYWDESTRQAIAAGERPKVKSRGINAEDFARCLHELDRQFLALSNDLSSGKGVKNWPSLTSHLTFAMVSAKQALARGTWGTCGHVDYDAVRVLSSDPETKRSTAFLACEDGVIRSEAFSEPAELESTPYDRYFGDAMEEFMLETDSFSPEGSNWDALREQLH